MSWFPLTPLGKLMSIGGCATEGCFGSAEWRLEADGVGSNYCGNCHAKIVAPEAALRQEQKALAYVQDVPDHCDRIIWRGHYYSLPILALAASQPQGGE